MVTFLTLLVGVISGTPLVRVAVTPPVAAVELRLDGRQIARMTAPGWQASLPLGEALGPFALEAVAFDKAGHELGRDRQLLNLGQRRADARLVPETDASGRVTAARLIWVAPAFYGPQRVTCSLDGRQVPMHQDGRIELPEAAGDAIHVLEAKVKFPEGISVSRTLLYGQGFIRATSAELTALPVIMEGKRMPPATGLKGWFTANGEELQVDSVEKGPSAVILVRDLGVPKLILGIFQKAGRGLSSTSLGKDDLVRVADVVPTAGKVDWSSTSLFPVSQPRRAAGRRGLIPLLMERPPQPVDRRVADAVAVAGITAVSDNRRRVVVLCLGDASRDRSQNSLDAVRSYLEALRVPLIVWHVTWDVEGKDTDETGWGEAVRINTKRRLNAAVKRLKKQVNRQRIVWVKGEYLPEAISLTPDAREIKLVR